MQRGKCPIYRPLFPGPAPLGREENKPSQGVSTSTFYVTATSFTAMNSRNRPTWKWAAEERDEQALEALWERIGSHRSAGFVPISCPVIMGFLGANPA